MALLHDRLVGAVAEIKATTTSSRNRNKFCVPEEIRQMASDAVKKSRDPVRRRHLRKIAQRARLEFEAGKAVLPRGKVINRPVFTKLWVDGRASEDRDEWTEDVRAHCESCYDDKAETRGAGRQDSTTEVQRRSTCSPSGASGPDHGG